MKQWFFPGLLFLFSLISVITIRSVAYELSGQQLIFFVVSFAVFFLTSKISFSAWVTNRWWLYLGIVSLLTFTLVLGTITRGTARWISVGGLFSIQGSQLAVPVVGILAAHLAVKNSLNSYSKIIKFLTIIAIPALLIVVAPDLGTTIIYLISLGTLLITTQTPWKYIWQLLALSALIATVSWMFLLRPYQKQRITGFISTQEQNLQTDQYNARQALIAVGSGRILGRGLGHGVQSQLRFLPERQTDFIFASLAEEWGFLGSITVLLLYVTTIVFLIRTALQTTNQIAKQYLLVTITMISTQTSINIGMNMNLFPITGITLPFLSYGGSSLVALAFNFGIVQNILSSIPQKQSRHLA